MKKLILFFLLIISSSVVGQGTNKIQNFFYLFQYDSAIVEINKALIADSTSAELHHQLGLTYFLQNDDRKALPCFEKCRQLSPDDIANLNYLSKTYSNLGQTTRAIHTLRYAARVDSTRKDIWNELGKILYREDYYREADSVYRILTTLQPDNANNLLMRARCATKQDSIEQANYHYARSYKIDSCHVKILFEYARNLFQMDSLQQAQTKINQAIRIESRNWQLYRLKGDIYFEQKQYHSAILAYLDAISRGDKSIAAYKKLGFSYYMIKNYSKCIHTFQIVLDSKDDDPVIYYYMGICFQEINDLGLAVHHLKKAIECLKPDFLDDIHSTLASCYYRAGHFQKSIQHYRQALELTDKKEEIYYQMANVYDDYYADKSVALKYYRLALKNEITPEITSFIQNRMDTIKKQQFLKK